MSLHDATELWLDAHYPDMVEWRRHLHAHPELGRQEFATTQFVASHLADAGLNPKVLPGGTGNGGSNYTGNYTPAVSILPPQ